MCTKPTNRNDPHIHAVLDGMGAKGVAQTMHVRPLDIGFIQVLIHEPLNAPVGDGAAKFGEEEVLGGYVQSAHAKPSLDCFAAAVVEGNDPVFSPLALADEHVAASFLRIINRHFPVI